MKRLSVGPKKVADLFEKYRKTLIAPERSVITAFVEVVTDVSGIAVLESQVSYQPGTKTIILKTRSALRSEILLHTEEILVHLKGRLGVRNAPTTIR